MYRVYRGRKRWRTRWPWSRLFPLQLDERFCRHCRQPYHNGPMPKEVKQFSSGSVGALIYPAGSWSRRALSVKFGRWKAGSRELFLSDFISAEDLPDLLKVAALAREFVNEWTGTESTRRRG